MEIKRKCIALKRTIFSLKHIISSSRIISSSSRIIIISSRINNSRKRGRTFPIFGINYFFYSNAIKVALHQFPTAVFGSLLLSIKKNLTDRRQCKFTIKKIKILSRFLEIRFEISPDKQSTELTDRCSCLQTKRDKHLLPIH